MSNTLCRHKLSLRGPRLAALQGRLQSAALVSRGSLMMEMVVAVMVYTLVGSAVLAGLSATYISGARSRDQSVAESLGRSQMEYVFSLPYQDPVSTYPSIAPPPGYGVSALAEEYLSSIATIEKVVVTVSHDGSDILVLETLRTKE
ncbi:MAG: hypothetical protein HW388_1552 [Dehalococcoidia bacterium]|nr:hypothetical protein [Dehalococcoidia bacterium]